MANKNLSKFHILKCEVSHGSDRHEVSIYSNKSPIVDDLLNELEKKTRVPKNSIQLIFKGQKLHSDPSAEISKFGIFSGNKLQMVGERLDVNKDAVFRRILGVSKDIDMIHKCLNDLQAEYAQAETGGLDRTMINEYVPQMHQRACGMQRDLEIFLRVVIELDIDENELPDVKKHQLQTIHNIKVDLKEIEDLLKKISNFGK